MSNTPPPSNELLTNSLKETRDLLRMRKISANELLASYRKSMQECRGLNAYITETLDEASVQADISDARLKDGTNRALEGIPIAVKDIFCTKNVRSTAASNILNNFIPTYSASVCDKLFVDGGAFMLGKTNMDEFGMGSSNENSHFGCCINPWRCRDKPDEKLVSGGSSGGSAVAVTANMAMAALGTDTGGSVRQPASFTGIVGMKPSYGRCSRWGIIAFASSLDQAGVFTKTVEDAAIMLKSIAGFDKNDSTSSQKEVQDFEQIIGSSIKGVKVGIPKEYQVDGLDDETVRIWQLAENMLRDAGAEIVPISLPHTKHALTAYYIIAPAEASSNLARYDGVRYGLRVAGNDLIDMYNKTRAAGFGDEVKRRIMIGTYALSAGYYDAYYRKAQKIRRLVSDDFKGAYEKCDIILAPTTPRPAFAVGSNNDDPLNNYLVDIFTVPTSLAGLPAISVPVDLHKSGLPMGMQLIGNSFDEQGVLKVAHILERAANFTHKPDLIK